MNLILTYITMKHVNIFLSLVLYVNYKQTSLIFFKPFYKTNQSIYYRNDGLKRKSFQ